VGEAGREDLRALHPVLRSLDYLGDILVIKTDASVMKQSQCKKTAKVRKDLRTGEVQK
jgi:hypothetical protein